MRGATPRFGLLAALVAGPLPAAAPVASAQSHIDQANAPLLRVPEAKRSDSVLLPVVAKMAPPPAGVSRVDQAMLLPAGSSQWPAAEAWAAADTQQAVLRALDQITDEEDPVDAMVFAQPYGAEAVASTSQGVALIQADLYTELGEPPMLAGAVFRYLPALERVACLVNVEATRRAAAGDSAGAIDVLADWVFFSRQMADRGFLREARWGLRQMITTLDRIRDIAYTDFRAGSRTLRPDHIAAVLNRFRADGYLTIDRLRIPTADRLAAEQVIDRVFIARNGPNADTFAPTMARLASTDRPLRLFSESARWQTVAAAGSANWFDQHEKLRRIYDDWQARWGLRPFDPLLSLQTEYEKMGRAAFAVLAAVVPDVGVLLNDRDVLKAQLVGTRCSLALVAFYYDAGSFPRDIAAIRPRYVRALGDDPFNPTGRDRGGEPRLEFFVPIRDTGDRFGPRETPRPHEINVFTPGGEYNFKARVGQDQFVLYSVGPNGAKEWAENATAEPVKNSIGDLLLWPPVISLYREELRSTGRLK